MIKNTFVLQMITWLEILDTAQTLKKHAQKMFALVGKEKFPKKLLIWIAVSERAMSEPLFRTSKAVAINTSSYINECLEKDFFHSFTSITATLTIYFGQI